MAFASPARDFNEKRLNLDQLLPNKSSTYYMKAKGAMPGAGISTGDILVIDRALDVRHGDIAVCWTEGSFVLYRVGVSMGRISFFMDDDTPAASLPEINFWGVVTMVLKRFR